MIKVDFVGGKELEQALRDLRKEMKGKEGNIIRNGLNYTARTEVVPDLQKAAPRSEKGTPLDWYKDGYKWRYRGDYYAPPGRLARAMKHAVVRNPRVLDELVGAGVFSKVLGESPNDPQGAWYAYIVEYKTGFMKNAFNQNSRKWLGKIEERWGVSIEKAAKKIGNENARRVGAAAKARGQSQQVGVSLG